ncbi:MAG: radical SAM protein [Bacteroidetes bacterium]|nr:radical SAM protein [Bacteroidota bacterium]
MKRVLLIEPAGNFIRLDRCMQSIDSWGGVYRFPLNLSRIAAHLINKMYSVKFIDLQSDNKANLIGTLLDFKPDLCILSSGFPSMEYDSNTAKVIKEILPNTHVSTFGVVPTLLKDSFFDTLTWGFDIHFDSIIMGGEPAIGYEELLQKGLKKDYRVVDTTMQKIKLIDTKSSRHLFNHSLYKSPFTGENATYIEGTYGCPYKCNFCVVPILYGNKFSKRTPQDIIAEFKYVIENNDIHQITLWDEGTSFEREFILELCDGLIELRKCDNPRLRNFVWTTRSTTALLDDEIVEKLALSGLSGITLGIESFDKQILNSVEKKISLESNLKAIELLAKYDIISIGHIILGHLTDTKESVERTIQGAVNSGLDFAQFYCAVPYPNTKLHKLASVNNLIRVNDLTKYELSNPIMDTLGGLTFEEVGEYRNLATKLFWTKERWENLDKLINSSKGITKDKKQLFLNWNNGNNVDNLSEIEEMPAEKQEVPISNKN